MITRLFSGNLLGQDSHKECARYGPSRSRAAGQTYTMFSLVKLLQGIVMCVYVLVSIISAMFSWVLRRKCKDISEDIILITGGGSGIGRQIAINIAQHRPKHVSTLYLGLV